MTAPRTRRREVVLTVLIVGLWGGAGRAASPERADDMALGSPRAPVTVIEYASVGCPHCAIWERNVFPTFRKLYIDPGKVRFVFREMLNGDPALAAAGFLTARCAGPGKYFQVVDAVFAGQDQIAKEGGATGTLAKIARDAGLSEPRFTACLSDKAGLAALQARVDRHETQDKISGTPTFVIAGRKLEGEQGVAELGAAVAAASHR
jgi:protein-disulfide isomerase